MCLQSGSMGTQVYDIWNFFVHDKNMDTFSFKRRPKGQKEIFSFPYVSTTVNYTPLRVMWCLCVCGVGLWHMRSLYQHSRPNMFRGTFATTWSFLHDSYAYLFGKLIYIRNHHFWNSKMRRAREQKTWKRHEPNFSSSIPFGPMLWPDSAWTLGRSWGRSSRQIWHAMAQHRATLWWTEV